MFPLYRLVAMYVGKHGCNETTQSPLNNVITIDDEQIKSGGGRLDRDVSGGVSVCRVEDITEALWFTRVSPSRCLT
jgi:hypothetical protein